MVDEKVQKLLNDEAYLKDYKLVHNEKTVLDIADELEYKNIYGKMSADVEQDELSEALLETEVVNSVGFLDSTRELYSDTLKNIEFIVYVLIIAAGMLAFIVLYNLTNINVSERSKEIGTIKVLGFYEREVDLYVYRENSILTFIGSLVGVVLGIPLHAFIIQTAEVDAVMFGREITVPSFLYSIALTKFFATLVNLVMTKKLRRISMVESMKAQ